MYKLPTKLKFLTVIGLLISVSIMCDESLPPYRDPENVFTAYLGSEYLYSINSNSLALDLVIVNIFDETFSAPAKMEGTITIFPAQQESFTARLTVTANNIMKGKYIHSNRELTMDPGDTLRLRVLWNFIDDNGRDLRHDVFLYKNDPDCEARRISDPVIFHVSSDFIVYERTGVVHPDTAEIKLCHVNTWVPSQVCVSLRADEACDKISESTEQ